MGRGVNLLCLDSLLKKIHADMDQSQDSTVYSEEEELFTHAVSDHRNAHEHVYFFSQLTSIIIEVLHQKSIVNAHSGAASAFHKDESV